MRYKCEICGGNKYYLVNFLKPENYGVKKTGYCYCRDCAEDIIRKVKFYDFDYDKISKNEENKVNFFENVERFLHYCGLNKEKVYGRETENLKKTIENIEDAFDLMRGAKKIFYMWDDVEFATGYMLWKKENS